jgi:signal transduction histidine kinase
VSGPSTEPRRASFPGPADGLDAARGLRLGPEAARVGRVDAPARILVVEEDVESRATMDLLLGARWDVKLVDRGDAGWKAARERSHDLVIASVRLPGMSGIELTRRLRHNRGTQDVALILTSRSAQQGETLAGLEAGADDFLVKPFSGRELLARVNTRLELIAMRRRNVQQEEALANLQRNLKARDEFLSAASHELRTPITTLSLQTESLIALDDALEPRLQKRLVGIRRQVDRLTQLVDQLLDVSRLIEGRMELQPEPVELGAVVKESVELLRDSALRAGSPISVRAEDEVVGRWDRMRVGQVITNLLSNAIKFGGGRPIEVTVEADERDAHLRVSDRGEGIPPQEQARIFDRFERATSVRHHPGLGLGLWICKQIVEASRGAISVRSQVGKGTTFSVDLPKNA